MNDTDTIKAIQTALGVKPDGIWGPLSQHAFDVLIHPGLVPADPTVHLVKATSFADPSDVRAFRACKAQGKSDQECFKVGDNGLGKWGDDCTADLPICALPFEDWSEFGDFARGKPVIVRANGQGVVCELRDTMPHRFNITNGAGLDLNPAACKALGLVPPVLTHATWQWE